MHKAGQIFRVQTTLSAIPFSHTKLQVSPQVKPYRIPQGILSQESAFLSQESQKEHGGASSQ